MRAVAQRVASARVTAGDRTVGAIGPGLLAYLGVGVDDGPADVAWMANKIATLRIFADSSGAMNRSLAAAGGSLLLISQFTLFADARKGRRPSFAAAAAPEIARGLFDEVVQAARALGLDVETGEFGAHMRVSAEVDGPVTILLDSKRTF